MTDTPILRRDTQVKLDSELAEQIGCIAFFERKAAKTIVREEIASRIADRYAKIPAQVRKAFAFRLRVGGRRPNPPK